MNNSKKVMALLAFVLLFSASAFSAMKMKMSMPKGTEGTWEGYVTGNFCASMGMKVCPPNGLKTEVPVFVPEKNGLPDFKNFFYFVTLPRDKQNALFNKEVKVTGTLYSSHSSIAVKSIEVNEGGKYNSFWMEHGMGMSMSPKMKTRKTKSSY